MAPCLALVLLFSFSCVVSDAANDGPPTLDDLVLPEGYPFEQYVARTEDGYNLGLFRIPHGRNERATSGAGPRPVVYLQHGLLDTSAAFLMNGANGSLAFILADNGFDVWFGNSRGNTFSNFEMQQNIDHDEFWNFSMDELAKYDVPACLQFALDHTGVQSLVYIGHSQGTALGHALFSMQHPITQRISLAFMMSPVAFVTHITSHFLRGLAFSGTDDLVASLGFHQFLPAQKDFHRYAGPFCRGTSQACADIAAVLYGYNPDNLDPARWDTYLSYCPAGASVKLMAHWAQGVRNRNRKRFQAYDYGSKCWYWMLVRSRRCNQLMYKSRLPPEYDLSKIRVPMIYYYGGHDALADLADVLNLKRVLAPGVLVEDHLLLDYTHLDFIWGLNAPARVYVKIIHTIKTRQPAEVARLPVA